MSAPAELAVGGTSLFTVHAAAGSWAIPSFAVSGVEPLAVEAQTDAPDALTLIGLPGEGEEASRRIVVVRFGAEQARLVVRGAIALTDATPQELLPLPRELALAAPLVSHIAVVAGKPAVFVVSPERLVSACRDAVFASTPNDTDAARGSSC